MTLKPCPFCGGPAAETEEATSNRSNARIMWTLGCENIKCGVRPLVKANWSRGGGNDKEIKALRDSWNKRVNNHSS